MSAQDEGKEQLEQSGRISLQDRNKFYLQFKDNETEVQKGKLLMQITWWMSEWHGQIPNLNFLNSKHKVLKIWPLASLSSGGIREWRRENSQEEIGQ